MASPLGKNCRYRWVGKVRVRTQTWAALDLSCPLPALGQFPQLLWLPLHPFCGLPAAARLPTPSLSTVLPHGRGQHGAEGGWAACPRSHGQKGGGCPRRQHLQALDQRVSTGPSIQAYPESHPQETSHNPMEGKSTENWPVLVQSVNVTKDRKRAKRVSNLKETEKTRQGNAMRVRGRRKHCYFGDNW